jgi:hypothetical protein
MNDDPKESRSASAWKPARQRRRGLYYRVEVYDQTSLCWLDAPGTFGTVDEASHYITRELNGRRARIMKIDGRKRSVVP